MNNPKGQVTMFIIIALVIVAIVVLIIFLTGEKDPEQPLSSDEESIERFLQTCLEDSVYESLDVIGRHGGDNNPEFNVTFKYQNEPSFEDIGYLCHTYENNTPCVNSEPLLLKKVEREIKEYIDADVDNCKNLLGQSLYDQGYVPIVRYTPGDFAVDLDKNNMNVNINIEISLTRGNQTISRNGVDISFETKFYDLVRTTERIIRDDVVNCNFNIADYIWKYPKFKIDRQTTLDDFSDIYTVEIKGNPEMFRFATRGCVEV